MPTRIDFQVSNRAQCFVACLAIARHASSRLLGAQKTVCGTCGTVHYGWYDRAVRQARDLSNGDTRIFLEFEVRRVDCRSCGQVKCERLAFLADNTHYTERFAYYVGRRCRAATVQDVAKELHLDWHAVKDLEKQYMRAQLARVGTPGPKAIGIDEISIRKGQTYRIVVSDLIRKRPIWFGGADRKEASMALFYDWCEMVFETRI
ncbi:MAG: transposase family protein [Comamonadaceae bacterium]|nr:transposase family protein [Comamonadaceae bacterium]